MHTILVVVHLFLAIGIIGLVLMQHGKGADAGAAFGSGASGTVFGARGSANFLSRSTAILASLFFVTSLALAWFAMKSTDRGGLMDKVEAAPPAAAVNAKTAVPAIPGGGAPEAKPSAVPAIPEGKPAEAPVAAAEAPSKVQETAVEPTPQVETTAAFVGQSGMQGESQPVTPPVQTGSQPEPAPSQEMVQKQTPATEPSATGQVPAKAE